MTELTAFGGLAEGQGWPVTEPIDTTAWSPVLEDSYRALAPALLGYFRSHRLDQAEDLVGDVFVSVARNLHRFHGDPDDFRRWVFAIAHRRRVDHVRRWRVRRRVVAEDPPERASVEDRRALDIDLVAALGELTPRQREVVILRFVADLPLENVARIIGRRIGAVKALQARALDQLAQRLDPPPAAPTIRSAPRRPRRASAD
jgi:RNA polymerase sigma-70 factor (ECF subfamily)